MREMFCFQCQQTAHNTGCDGKAGVCGKKADTANYQDELIGALIGLARAARAGTPTPHTDELILKGLFTTITNVDFNNETILQCKAEIEKEKAAVGPGQLDDYDLAALWAAGEDVRSLKSLILFGLKGMAAYAYHARALGRTDPAVNAFFYEALEAIGAEKTPDELLALVLKTGEVNLACMALLDAANTGAYGDPVPVTVPLTIEKGPFIVVSGHDLHDLKLLLDQTAGRGINIYTHSEMLPAHGYPELKKYPHLKGNFGTGWQNQQSEFHNIPAPILFTTNSMGFIIAAAVAAAVIAFCFLCYKKAPPTQAIVVTGFGLSRPKVVCGRGVFVLPIVQRADRLNMRLLKIDVKTPETGVKTKEGVSLWLDSVVTVQVYSENSTVSDEEVRNAGYDDIRKYINSRQQSAISNFLGMDEAHINEKINDVLQGNLREIVSEMTVDQILTNRKQMAVSVVENARPDLAKMGLEVVTFNVQDVKDAVDAMGHNHGVIEAIGVEQEELVKKRASIAKAEAERDVSCAKAAAAMAANEKEIEAQTAIAQRNNELELAKSKLKAEADKAAADANAAGMIQTNLRAKEVKESEADAEIARQKKMVDLAAQEAEVQQRKLDAEVRKQADAELYRRQKEAEAQKYEAERAAEAAKFAKQQEAEGIALVGKAEAEAIRQKGLAEAEAMKQKAEAYKQYNDAAVAEMMIKVLPEIARSVAQPLSSIDKVSIIGGDASGVSGVSGNVPVLMAQTMEAMKEATGIDMRDIVRANSIEAKTDRNITIKTEDEE